MYSIPQSLYCLEPHIHSHALSPQTHHSPSSQYVPTISKYFFSPIPPLHNSLHLHGSPHLTFYTRFHYSRHPILSLQTPLSGNSFPQHALLTAKPYSTSMSLIYISRSTRILFLRPIFTSMDTFLPFITLARECDTPTFHSSFSYFSFHLFMLA